MREMYWKLLNDLKFRIEYITIYRQHADRITNSINIILAVAATGSIATLKLWEKYSTAWLIISVAIVVIQAAKDYLPYKERDYMIRFALRDFECLMSEAEREWRKMELDDNDESYTEKYDEMKKRFDELEQRHFSDDDIPERFFMRRKAEKRVKRYADYFLNIKRE